MSQHAAQAAADRASAPQPSPWSIWWAGTLATLFTASVVMPVLFLVPGLFRPATGDVYMRREAFWLMFVGISDRREYADDPVRALSTIAGILAAVALIGLGTFIIVRLVGSRGRAWPRRKTSWPTSLAAAVAASSVGMGALAAGAFVAPVPSRPFAWWFLCLGVSTATVWLSRRRAGVVPAALILVGSVGLAIAVDLLAPLGEAAASPGGTFEVVALLATLGAFVAFVIAVADRGDRLAAGDAPAEPPDRLGLVIGTAAAAALGLLVVWISASAIYSTPAATFGDVRGRRVVLLSPHLDDESAFAGETISWLSSHGADVTVVFTTDSAGGRALYKTPAYLAGRKEVWDSVRRTLGVAHVYTIDTVKDGNRMAGPRKVLDMERFVAANGLVGPDTLLLTVSGTGQSDHRATFTAAREIARRAGVPLYVYWGYDESHDAIMQPQYGVPLRTDGGPRALAAKAAAVDDYLAFYEDRWPHTLPRILLTSRGAHDSLSVITTSEAKDLGLRWSLPKTFSSWAPGRERLPLVSRGAGSVLVTARPPLPSPRRIQGR